MITRFHVENFKALKDVTLDLSHSPIHVLIGPNDSGKTSILQAMAALSRSVDHNYSNTFFGKKEEDRLIWENERLHSIQFVSIINEYDWKFNYQLSLKLHSDNSFVTKSETLEFKYPTSSGTINFSSSNYNGSGLMLAHRGVFDQMRIEPEKEVQSRNACEALCESLEGVRYYNWNSHFLALPVAINTKRNLQMEYNGFGLAQFLDDILGENRNAFIELEERFCKYFPEVESIRLMPESAFQSPIDDISLQPEFTKADGKGIWIKFKEFRHPISAVHCSEGMIIFLAYLAVLFSPKPPRLLLIEEPENGIHPQRLREIIKMLRELATSQSHTQIVMTTHSTNVVDEFAPEEVTLCGKDSEGAVQTRRLSDIPEVVKHKDFFTLGGIWQMEGDDRLLGLTNGKVGVGS